jgi:hypothetical protein
MATIYGPDIKPNGKYRASERWGFRDVYMLYEIPSEKKHDVDSTDWNVKISQSLAFRIRGHDKTKSIRKKVEELLEYALTHKPR